MNDRRAWLAERLHNLADAVEIGHATQTVAGHTLQVDDIVATFTVLLGADGKFCISSFGGTPEEWERIMTILATAVRSYMTDPNSALVYEILKASQ